MCYRRAMRHICMTTITAAVAAGLIACGGRPETAPDPEPEAKAPMTEKLAPPVAKRVEHTHIAHEHGRPDPYHWLRDDDRDDPEVLAYLEAENAYTEAALAPSAAAAKTLLEELEGRIEKDDRSVPVERRDFWYVRRYEGESEYPIYARHAGSLDAPEQIMLDVNALAEPHDYYAIGGMAVSEGQHLLAYSEDPVSRRKYTVRVKNLKTGETLPDQIPETSGAVAWAADDQTLFYVKKDPETLRPYQVWRHTLGTPVEQDVMVFEDADEAFYVSLSRSRSRAYVTVYSQSTEVTETLFLKADDPAGAFRPVVPRRDKHEYQVWHKGDAVYIRTNDDATDFRLVRAPVDKAADRSAWETVIPHREGIWLGSVLLFDDWYVYEERVDGIKRLRAAKYGEPLASHRTLPADEQVYVMGLPGGQNPSFDTAKVRYVYSSPVTPDSVYEYDLATGARTLLKQDKVLGGYDPANYRTARIDVMARDGAQVPVSIVHRADTAIDGSAPLYVYGYGSYGYTIDPDFTSSWVSLLDRGFVIAVAHVRGSQARGRRWYDDGRLMRKMNTFTDFIDVTEKLVADGWGAKDEVVAGGGSAGGLLMGAVINMRPELYRAIYAAVPFVDVVSTMLDESIPLTTGEFSEWGNPKEKPAYDYMLGYSPYDNVSAKAYPAMIVTTGLHDSQVQYWEPAKWVARLRANKTDDNLLVLDTEMETGHGGASGRFKRLERTARVYAFFLQVLGMLPAEG